jgi:hypothetical protein
VSMLKKLEGSKQSKLFSECSRQTRQPRAQLLDFGRLNALFAEKWVPVARGSICTVASSVGLLSARRLRFRRGDARQLRLRTSHLAERGNCRDQKHQPSASRFLRTGRGYSGRHTHILQVSCFTRAS